MQQIQASVGLRGTNRRDDVSVVQRLLDGAGVSPGPIDGRCGRLTMHAIGLFQSAFLSQPDARVDVNGPTWRRLSGGGRTAAPAPASAPRAAPPAASPPPPARPATRAVPVPSARRLPIPTPAPSRPQAQAARPMAPAAAASPPPARQAPAPGAREFWRKPTALPARGTVNRGLQSPRPAEQIARFGRPSEKLYRDGGPITNRKLLALMVTESVGPFRVTGIRPAVASLREVLAQVAREQPELYRVLGTAGMLNNRLQRGSSTALSNHAFGTAIDFTVGGILTARGSNSSSRGLDTLAPFFNRAGWYWGATFSTDDAMHFECGTALLNGFDLG